MAEQDAPAPRKNWFGLITEGVLDRSGPAPVRVTRRQGADVYAGMPSPKPGDTRTRDIYAQATEHRRDK